MNFVTLNEGYPGLIQHEDSDSSGSTTASPKKQRLQALEVNSLFGSDSEVDDNSGNSDYPSYSNLSIHEDLSEDEDASEIPPLADLSEDEDSDEDAVEHKITLPFVKFAGNYRKISSDSDSDTD